MECLIVEIRSSSVIRISIKNTATILSHTYIHTSFTNVGGRTFRIFHAKSQATKTFYDNDNVNVCTVNVKHKLLIIALYSSAPISIEEPFFYGKLFKCRMLCLDVSKYVFFSYFDPSEKKNREKNRSQTG